MMNPAAGQFSTNMEGMDMTGKNEKK